MGAHNLGSLPLCLTHRHFELRGDSPWILLSSRVISFARLDYSGNISHVFKNHEKVLNKKTIGQMSKSVWIHDFYSYLAAVIEATKAEFICNQGVQELTIQLKHYCKDCSGIAKDRNTIIWAQPVCNRYLAITRTNLSCVGWCLLVFEYCATFSMHKLSVHFTYKQGKVWFFYLIEGRSHWNHITMHLWKKLLGDGYKTCQKM